MQSLAEFLDSAADKPYRQLVEHHIRRQSTEQIVAGLQGEVELLPAALRPYVETFIDVVNDDIGYDRAFWASASCGEAAEAISHAAAQVIPAAELSEAFESTRREGPPTFRSAFSRSLPSTSPTPHRFSRSSASSWASARVSSGEERAAQQGAAADEPQRVPIDTW
jgi:hypothetical protein